MGPNTRAGDRRIVATAGILGALVASLLVLAPTAGAQGWGDPVRLSDERQVRAVEYAAGPDGYAVAVWSAGRVVIDPGGGAPPGGRVSLARRDPGGGGFSEPVDLGRGDGIAVAVAADGSTVVSWRRPDGAAVTTSTAPGEPLRAPTVLTERPSGLSIEVADDGRALAVWRDRSRPNAILAAFAERPDEGFGDPQLIRSRRPIGVFPPVASLAGREAVVAWPGRCPQNGRRATPAGAAFASGDGTFGEPQIIPGSRCPTSPLETEIAASGRAYLLLNGRGRRAAGVRGSLRRPGAEFGAARRLGRPSGRASLFGRLTQGARDGALAVWETVARRPVRNGLAFARGGAGGFGSQREIARRAGAGAVDLDSNACGDALVAWQSLRTRRFAAATIAPGTGLRRLGAVGRRLTSGNDLSVAVGEDGRVGIAWTRDRARGFTGRGVFVVENGSIDDCGPR
ncbi:hypothetical protein HJD18_06230 [Thermoleophilia bacterium SCSIO 60948]|nr:hypothetical protein HJD18_06230 [Thermoleophilia bacterium SCSIO 60948]